MNEEPSANETAETTETTATKQLIDRPDIKLKLNDIVSSLSSEKIDYETFYREISQYRVELNPEHFSGGKRMFIETQRKRDWRKREEKNSRNKRHRR
jgi:hypothetical protein